MFWVKLDSLDIVLLSLAESFLYVFIMSYLPHANLVIGSYIYNRRQNCWDIALKWSLENKTIHTPPQGLPSSIQSCHVCRFLQDRTAVKHFVEMGRESVISPFLCRKNDRKAL